MTPDGQPSDDFKAWIQPITTPVGTVVLWASQNLPDGWLLCNGAEVSRTTYAALFTVIGTTWGAASSVANFLLPDMRGFVAAGANGTSFPFGNGVGAETVTLSMNELPAHTHDLKGYGLDNALVPVGYFGAIGPNAAGSLTGVTESTGGGQAHSNIQPSKGLHFIIKT